MLTLALRRVRTRAWAGFKAIDSGFLPTHLCWLQPDAAESLEAMQEACGQLMQFRDVFRSVTYQARLVTEPGDRDYARPTQSGHNFGMSVDVALVETLSAFLASGQPDLVAAGRDRGSLARWMRQFGWQPTKTEAGHFNHLAGHETVLARIDALYDFELDNVGVQVALNKLVGSRLDLNGVLDQTTDAAAAKAYKILGHDDRGAFSAWFRRLLAGATAEIVEA